MVERPLSIQKRNFEFYVLFFFLKHEGQDSEVVKRGRLKICSFGFAGSNPALASLFSLVFSFVLFFEMEGNGLQTPFPSTHEQPC